MAFYPNPYYGAVPGAPQGVHRWIGNEFSLSGLPPVPLPPLPPPPPPLAATPTAQDAAVRPVAAALASTGGAEPGGGGPGGGPGGIGPGAYPGQPNPGMGGGVGAPGGDQTFSGYPGVYAQAPGELDSQFGSAGGTIGALGGSISGIPGPGTVLGFGGGALDAARYNAINAQYGVPGHINPWLAGATSVLEGIGVPFTNWNLATLFDVPSTRARQLGLVDDAGYIGREDMGYGALQANAPHSPGAPFGNTGWAAGMDPTRGSYPAGFIESGLQPSHGLPAEQAAQLNLDVERTIAANPDVFGAAGQAAAPSAGGVWNDVFGGAGNFGTEGQSVDPADGNDGLYARGGLIGAPPGRFAAGGAVAPPAANITPAQFGLLRGIDPPGPDDQIAAVQSGEGVLTAKTMARYPGLLNAANAGKINPKKLTGLLAVVPAKARRR